MRSQRLRPAFLLALSCLLVPACRQAGNPLFTDLPAERTGVHFTNQLEETDQLNIIKYLYFYNGAGVGAGDLNNDGLPDLFFTANQGADRLFLNEGDFRFRDVTTAAGLAPVPSENRRWKTGVTLADVNGDGWLDIYVCEVGFYKSINGRNRLYINQGTSEPGGIPSFSEQAPAYGLDFKGFAQQAAFLDYDRDGDLDLFLVCHSVHSAESYARGEARTTRDSLARDILFRNDGGRFTDVSEKAGIFGGPMGYGLGLVVSDVNQDGWPDLYLTNDFHEHDYLYLHAGRQGLAEGPVFREEIVRATGHTSTFSMGVDAADLNNDGWPDIMSLDMQPADEQVLKASAGADHYNLDQMKRGYGYHYQYPRNCLQIADGQLPADSVGPAVPRFAEVAALAGVATTDWSWGALLADFDNDGWKDIFVSNGIFRRPNDLDYLRYASAEEVQRNATDRDLAGMMPPGAVGNYAFRNRCDASGNLPQFEDVSQAWGLGRAGYAHGSAWADLDGDGDLDLVVNNLNAPASVLRNETVQRTGRHFLRLHLQGSGGNTAGIGAKVWVSTPAGTQLQELFPTRGWLSAMDPTLVFGLDTAATVSRLRVEWPDGRTQVLEGIPADRTLTLRQSEAGAIPADDDRPDPVAPSGWFSARPFAGPGPTHRENRFVDFNIEPLLPYLLSTQGPRLAVGDVNGDGTDDFYRCGAKAQAGELWLSASGDSWRPVSDPFAADFLVEEVAATFLDVDADGDLDLFVASGGGEYRPGAEQLRHRLFRNDGTGGMFPDTVNAWPSSQAGCVIAADMDADGFTDLFIGGRSIPGSYGLPPRSYLLYNDGTGRFSDRTAERCPGLDTAGMVTAAVWLPGTGQLVVAGEWMPLTSWTPAVPAPPTVVPGSAGLWNTLVAFDADGDGDLDLVGGNFGRNSQWTATSENPLSLFVGDIDGNGATDPLLTYVRQGQRYPFASRDELVGQLPDLRKRFGRYADFAESTFGEVFRAETLRAARRLDAETLASTYFENRGEEGFRAVPLPPEAQVSPVFAILPADVDADGFTDLLLGGNLHAVQPSLGRQDAGAGTVLLGEGNGRFRAVPRQEHSWYVPGEIRDLRSIRTREGGFQWLVARNNDTVLRFALSRPLR